MLILLLILLLSIVPLEAIELKIKKKYLRRK